MTTTYTDHFYTMLEAGSRSSAEVYIGHLASTGWTPESVVDVGCGRGVWLAEWAKRGVPIVVGIDGAWVKQSDMLDPRITFTELDLTQPLSVDTQFDLAMSLEVAEHLPESAADTFVDSLCALSDAVLFSAAFVGQAGTNHVNCQLHSYWAVKFAAHGYACFDLFRPRFWNDMRIEPWYRANTFLYVYPRHTLDGLRFRFGQPLTNLAWCDAVHPWLYMAALRMEQKNE